MFPDDHSAPGSSWEAENSNIHPTGPHSTELHPAITHLLQAAMRQSTLQAYELIWLSFKTFMRDVLNIHNPLPASPYQVALFIAKTYGDVKKHTTILNYISAIKQSKGQQPSLTIQALGRTPHCPVVALSHYFHRRPSNQWGPLFLIEQGTPISRTFLLGN